MKLQPKWLREAIRQQDEAYIRQDDICNHIEADMLHDNKFASFELHPDYDKWVYACCMTERAAEHAKLMEHRWQSLTASEQYEEVRK